MPDPSILEQICQKRRRAGILGSKRGPTGGYFLARKPEEITVGEIVRVTEGGLNPVLCVDPQDSRQPCDKITECVTRIVWDEAGNRLKEYFDSVTINDLCTMAMERGLKRELDKRFMYYI